MITNSILQARQRGASDEQILKQILLQNPEKRNVFQEAQNRGANSNKVLEEIIKQNTNKYLPTEEEKPSYQEIPSKWGKAARFLGSEKLGQRIGAGLAQLSPTHRETLKGLEESEQKGFTPAGTTKTLKTGGVSEVEALGGLALTALNVVLPFGSKALAPALKGLTAKVLTKASVYSSLIGSGFGTAGAMEEGGDLKDVKEAAVIGAVFGIAFPPLTKLFQASGGAVTGLPRRFYNTIFKRQKEVILKELKKEAKGIAYDTTAEFMLMKEKLQGGLFPMAKEVQKRYDFIENQIQKHIKKTLIPDITINKKKYILPLQEIIGQYKAETFTKTGTEAQNLLNRINKVKGNKIDQQLALEMRRFFDSLRSRPSFKNPTNPLSRRQENLQMAAEELRNKLAIANPALKEMLNREKHLIIGLDNLVDEIVRTGNTSIISLTDVFLGGGGITTGVPLAGAGAMLAARTFKHPRIMTGSAQIIQKTIDPIIKGLETDLPRKFGKVGTEIGKTIRQAFYSSLGR